MQITQITQIKSEMSKFEGQLEDCRKCAITMRVERRRRAEGGGGKCCGEDWRGLALARSAGMGRGEEGGKGHQSGGLGWAGVGKT